MHKPHQMVVRKYFVSTVWLLVLIKVMSASRISIANISTTNYGNQRITALTSHYTPQWELAELDPH